FGARSAASARSSSPIRSNPSKTTTSSSSSGSPAPRRRSSRGREVMNVHREVRNTVFVLLLIQLTTSLGAIALLGRSGSAIERILADNDYSLEAVDDMLHILATAETGRADGERLRLFRDARSRALDNVTDERERPLLQHIESD